MKLTALLLLSVFVSVSFGQNTTPAQMPTMLSSDGARYVFGQAGTARADQYLLDTKTGRLWLIVMSEEGQKKLQAVPFIGVWMGQDSLLPDSDADMARYHEFARELAGQEMMKKFQKTKTE